MNVKLLKKGLFIFLISFYSLTSYSQKIHEVKKGETLFAISKMYEIPIDSLININELNNYSLSIGQKLIVELEIPKKNDELKTNKSLTVTEEGFASSIDEDTDDRYLALHKNAEVGTIIFVKNQMNDNMVIVRVIGKLPETGDNKGVNIKLSATAFEKLEAVDKIIPIEMTYVLEEKKISVVIKNIKFILRAN